MATIHTNPTPPAPQQQGPARRWLGRRFNATNGLLLLYATALAVGGALSQFVFHQASNVVETVGTERQARFVLNAGVLYQDVFVQFPVDMMKKAYLWAEEMLVIYSDCREHTNTMPGLVQGSPCGNAFFGPSR